MSWPTFQKPPMTGWPTIPAKPEPETYAGPEVIEGGPTLVGVSPVVMGMDIGLEPSVAVLAIHTPGKPLRLLHTEDMSENAARWSNPDGFVWLAQSYNRRGTYLASELRNLWAVTFDPHKNGWAVSKDRQYLEGWGAGPFKTERLAQEFVETQIKAQVANKNNA